MFNHLVISTKQQLHLNTKTHVNHLLAGPILNVVKSIIKLFVLVCPTILEPPLDVVQNVLLVRNALLTRRVQIKNALILVQEHVGKMQIVA
jgi:hypothetical protein